MALHRNSVKKGIELLQKINPGGRVVKIENYDKNEDDIFSTKYIYCIGEKLDGGFEDVFTNIENITDDQLEEWNELKKQIPNSSITSQLKKDDYPYYWPDDKKNTDITRIGWF